MKCKDSFLESQLSDGQALWAFMPLWSLWYVWGQLGVEPAGTGTETGDV